MLHTLLKPKHLSHKVRWGTNKDGGYVIASEYMHVSKLISCGCDNQTSFEEDYLNHNTNGHVDIYDLKNRCDLANHNKNVKFYNTKISSFEQIDTDQPCIIQMDIEGSEFDVLNSYCGTFSNVLQLIIELHFNFKGNLDSWSRILQKLNQHFYLIHIHGNNFSSIGKYAPVPDVIECTYINKSIVNESLNDEHLSYPIPNLDYPNRSDRKDIKLDWWIAK